MMTVIYRLNLAVNDWSQFKVWFLGSCIGFFVSYVVTGWFYLAMNWYFDWQERNEN